MYHLDLFTVILIIFVLIHSRCYQKVLLDYENKLKAKNTLILSKFALEERVIFFVFLLYSHAQGEYFTLVFN